jgi:hypothetical protein
MTSLKRHLGNGPLTISVPTVERWPFFLLLWLGGEEQEKHRAAAAVLSSIEMLAG